MGLGREVSTGRPATETELKLAEALGLKTEDGLYRDWGYWDGINRAMYTSPPRFSTDSRWIPHLRGRAEQLGIILESDGEDPEVLAREFLDKLNAKGEG